MASAPPSLPALIAALLATTLIVPWATAETLPVGEVQLDSAHVRVELHNAVVDLVSDATARPTLRVWYDGETAGGTPPELDRTIDDDGVLCLRLRGSDEATQTDARIARVEILVGAEQHLVLAGNDLRITAREIVTPGVTAPLGVHYDIADSQLEIIGGRPAQIASRDSSIWLEGSRGLLRVSTTGGTAKLDGHDGELDIVSSGTELTGTNWTGRVDLGLDGGSLFLVGGEGELVMTAQEADLVIERWQGPLELAGDGATLEARETTAKGSGVPWKLGGTLMNLLIEDVAAETTVTLEGGRLEARRLTGALHVDARDLASVEVSDLRSNAKVVLAGGSDATFLSMQDLDLSLSEAIARVDDVERLTIAGSEAEISGAGIERIAKLELSASQLDLDLSRLGHDATLRLADSGDTRIDLSSPCLVRLSPVEGGGLTQPVDVVGCEIRLPGQPIHQTKMREIYGERTLRMLTLELRGSVNVSVSGQQ